MRAKFLLLAAAAATGDAAVIGITADIEDCESDTPGGCDGLLDAMGNSSQLVRAAGLGLRMSADAAIGWSYSQYSYHGKFGGLMRPVHEWLMDAVDEVVLMNYHSGCSETDATDAVCDKSLSVGWTFPFITYSQMIKQATDREVTHCPPPSAYPPPPARRLPA